MFRLFSMIVAFAFCSALPLAAAPLGPVQTARYVRVVEDAGLQPHEVATGATVTEVTLMLGPEEAAGGQPHQWFSLQFRRKNGQAYRVWALLAAWPAREQPAPIARYLWQEPDWDDALDYVHAFTGQPITSAYLWKYGWPLGAAGEALDPAAAFPPAIAFQGHRFRRVAVGEAAWALPPRITPLPLKPDLMIGYLWNTHDVEGRPRAATEAGTYRMARNTEAFVKEHLRAGYNRDASFVTPMQYRESCFVLEPSGQFEDWPAHLYRSNFVGASVFIDEPGYFNELYYREHPEAAAALTPREAVRQLQRIHHDTMHQPDRFYSIHRLRQRVAKNFDLGDLDLKDQNPITWEVAWPTIWYQMSLPEGTGVFIDEDEYVLPFVSLLNMSLGSQIPPTIEHASAIRIAILRGASRHFGSRWGVSIYSVEEFPEKLAALRHFYEAGASYVHLWNHHVDGPVHVPYPYQRFAASVLRSLEARQPHRDSQALLHVARTAIALPDGYTFHYGPMLRLSALPLEKRNAAGRTFREVLAQAALEVERCLRLGEAFDIVIDDAAFEPGGYDRVVYVREDATAEVVTRTGRQVFTELPVPFRPQLGPGPTIALQARPSSGLVPASVELQADPRAGSGTIALDAGGRPLVYFEILTPDGLSLRRDPEGPAITFEATQPGRYRIRASTADVFGRPAHEWTQFELEPQAAAVTLPIPWQFRTDPQHVGTSQRWYHPDVSDENWQVIPTDRPWEASIGDYDGDAWYRLTWQMPGSLAGKRWDLLLHVDEQAWVYLDGVLVGERTVASTGQPPERLWNQPFRLPVDDFEPGRTHVIAVRVHDAGHAGGLYQPVRLLER